MKTHRFKRDVKAHAGLMLWLALLAAFVLTYTAGVEAQEVIKCKNAINGDVIYIAGRRCPTGWYPVYD